MIAFKLLKEYLTYIPNLIIQLEIKVLTIQLDHQTKTIR